MSLEPPLRPTFLDVQVVRFDVRSAASPAGSVSQPRAASGPHRELMAQRGSASRRWDESITVRRPQRRRPALEGAPVTMLAANGRTAPRRANIRSLGRRRAPPTGASAAPSTAATCSRRSPPQPSSNTSASSTPSPSSSYSPEKTRRRSNAPRYAGTPATATNSRLRPRRGPGHARPALHARRPQLACRRARPRRTAPGQRFRASGRDADNMGGRSLTLVTVSRRATRLRAQAALSRAPYALEQLWVGEKSDAAGVLAVAADKPGVEEPGVIKLRP